MKKRKRTLHRLLAALCCLALIFSLAACDRGGKTTPDGSDPTGSGSGNGTASPQPEGYVYTAEFIPMQGETENTYFSNFIFDGTDRFLVSAYVYNDVGVIAYEEDDTLDGGDVEPEETEEPENDPMEPVAVPAVPVEESVYLYWMGLDGSFTRLENYKPLPVERDGDVRGDTYIMNLIISDGSIYSLEEIYRSWYDGPDDAERYSQEWYEKGYYVYEHNEESFFLRVLDDTGAEKSIIDLSEIAAEVTETSGYFYPSGFAADGKGHIILGAGNALILLDEEGNRLGSIPTDNWFEQTITLADGSVGVTYWGDNGQVISVVDFDAMALDEERTYPMANAYNLSPGGGKYDFYYVNGTSVMGYRLEDGTAERVINLLNVGVGANYVDRVSVLPDGRIVTTEYDYSEGRQKMSLVIMKEVPAASVPQKQTLTLATMGLDWTIRSAVAKYNRTNLEYRIEVQDYSEYDNPEDWSAGQTKLNTEIMAGNVPDILDLRSFSVSRLGARGLLADLTPYLEADSELSGQISDAVLEAMKTDGKLYQIATGYMVSTVIGAASVVGEEMGWTLEDFRRALASMPEGCEPFSQWTTRDTILSMGLTSEMSQLVDWGTGKCNFDSPRFTDLLEFAAQFPEEVTYDWENWTPEDEESSRIASGRQMLMQATFSSFDDISYYDAAFGGNCTFIGYPTSEGVGNSLSFNGSSYGISGRSPNKEAAWNFIRILLTEDYQNENVWYFPTNQRSFEKRLKDAMAEEYLKDEKGEYILDEDGNKIRLSRGGYYAGSTYVEIYAMTQEQADKVLALIESCQRVTSADEELMQMIIEDVQPFFAGQKTAQEVARLLQSKMNIYINEQR